MSVSLDCGESPGGDGRIYHKERFRGLEVGSRLSKDYDVAKIYTITGVDGCALTFISESVDFLEMERLFPTPIDPETGKSEENSFLFPKAIGESISKAEARAAIRCRSRSNEITGRFELSPRKTCESRKTWSLLKRGVLVQIRLNYVGLGATVFLVAYDGKIIGCGVLDADSRHNNELLNILF